MLPNQVLLSTNKNPGKYLIVDVNYQHQKVVVVDMLDNPPKRPRARPFKWVNEKLEAETFKLVDHEHPDVLLTPDNKLNSTWTRRRDEAYEAISMLVADPLYLEQYFYGDAEGILKLLIDTSGRTKKYVQSAINRYFRYDSVPNALLPRYFVVGKSYQNPENPIFLKNGKVCLKSKPGRKTTYGNPYRHVTKKDKADIKKFSSKLKNIKTINLIDIYRDYCREYCLLPVRPKGARDEDIAEECFTLLPRTHLISPRAFKRELKKCIGTLEFIRKRTGSILYARDHAGKPGMAKYGLRGPTSRYEIDSTIADVYIRYEYSDDERLSIGRPVVYFVIDVVTSMIVGLHVCFHGPDWLAESQALFNAFTDKVEFCKKFGVHIKKEDWPCAHVCRELTLDRGSENGHSAISSLLKSRVGINAANFNAYHRGDCKGTVEKAFDTIQSSAIPEHEGRVYKTPRKEDAHPSRRAVYTYAQFMKRVIKLILERNNTMARPDALNFEMCRDGIGLTPRDIWNWGLEEAVIPPPTKSIDSLRFALLKQDTATVTDKGVLFKGIYYNSDEVTALKWLDHAKNDGRFKVEIRYTDVNTSHIWCRHPDTQKVMSLEVTDRSERYKNRLWANVLAHMEEVKDTLARLDETRLNRRVLVDMDLAEMDNMVREQARKLNTSTAKGPEKGVKERKKQVGDIEKQQAFQAFIHDLNTLSSFVDRPDPSVITDLDLKDPTYSI